MTFYLVIEIYTKPTRLGFDFSGNDRVHAKAMFYIIAIIS